MNNCGCEATVAFLFRQLLRLIVNSIKEMICPKSRGYKH